MTTLYIDTNVVIDAVEGRKNIFGKNIGNPASDLFYQTISCKYHIIVSTWTLEELKNLGVLGTAKMFFEVVRKKTIMVTYTKEDKELAKQRSQEHPDDALHVILAEKQKADFIVTRNTDHFKQIKPKMPIKKPEELL